MAEVHGGVLAARQLKQSGIDTLFGVVAGPMIELFSGGQSEGLQVVGCRHEINGGFMASAWGWQKQRPGIFVAGSGPAVTNCVTPLYVATESAMPLVVAQDVSTELLQHRGEFRSRILGNPHLEQRELPLDVVYARHVYDAHDIHQLAQLIRDPIEN
mgnify:CR=1 FL=1